MDKVSYALGIGIGRQLSQMGAANLNIDDFAQAIKDVMAGTGLQVDENEAHAIVQDFFRKQEEKKRQERGRYYPSERITISGFERRKRQESQIYRPSKVPL